VRIAAEHLRKIGFGHVATEPLPPEFRRGLERARLGGRCEIRREAGVSWHLDGGHTLESITVAAAWFAGECAKTLTAGARVDATTPRILVFNQQTRSGLPLLRRLYSLLYSSLRAQPFTHVIFCSNVTSASSGYRPDLVSMNVSDEQVKHLTVQRELASGWRGIEDGCISRGHDVQNSEICIVATIEEALQRARSIAMASRGGALDAPRDDDREGGVKVFVTGSIHLVGGFIEVLEAEKELRETRPKN
jgi:folylpolyglutamate synthase